VDFSDNTMRAYRAAFIGLSALDVIYSVERAPAENEKLAASRQLIAAGGPATNAAVAFATLGGTPSLYSALGRHPASEMIRADLEEQGVEHVDLAPDFAGAPPLSSVLVTEATGSRAVVSANSRVFAGGPPQWTTADILKDEFVLVDGHQMDMSIEVAAACRVAGIPVMLDAGSWKPGTERLLANVDHAICSAAFRAPACSTSAETLAYLGAQGVQYRAITDGPRPIRFAGPAGKGTLDAAPATPVVDTMGAGDVFHGAYCFYILSTGGDFRRSLELAAEVAATSCTQFGPRAWIDEWRQPGGSGRAR